MSSINVEMRGLHARGDHPILIEGTLNEFIGSKSWGWTKVASLSTLGRSLYDESVSVLVPGRPASALVTFPASPFSDELYSIALTVEVPNESRGGASAIDVVGVGSFRNMMAVFRPDDPEWADLEAAFLSRKPIEFLLQGFEDFGTWTEPRSFTVPSAARLQAWGRT